MSARKSVSQVQRHSHGCKIQRKDGTIKSHVESWDKVCKGDAKERIMAWQKSQLEEPAASSDQPANEADEASGTDESCDANLLIDEENASDVYR